MESSVPNATVMVVVPGVVEPVGEENNDDNMSPSHQSRKKESRNNSSRRLLGMFSSVASSNNDDEDDKRAFFFSFMAKHVWFFVLAVPLLYCLAIGVGWSGDDEKTVVLVDNLWIPDKGSYARDQAYAASIGVPTHPASTALAIATARDGGNLLTASRLSEIRARMEQAETTMVRVWVYYYYYM